MGTVLKRGSDGWWTALALAEAADRYRKAKGLSTKDRVEISVDEVNKIIRSWGFFKRLCLLVTNGDIRELDLGEEVEIHGDKQDQG